MSNRHNHDASINENNRKKISRINSKVIKDFEYSLNIVLQKNQEKLGSQEGSLNEEKYDTLIGRDFKDQGTNKVVRRGSRVSHVSLNRASSKLSDKSVQRKSMVNIKKESSSTETSGVNDAVVSPTNIFNRPPFKWLGPLRGMNIPFETTLIQNLPMNTHVTLTDLNKTLLFSVKESDTVRSLKLQIEQKTNFSARSLQMFHDGKHLENKDMLPPIEHRLKSILKVSKMKKWRLKVVYQAEYKLVSIYSSDSIHEVKRLIAKCYELDVFSVILRLGDTELEGNHDVFYYQINETMEIIIEEKIIEVFDEVDLQEHEKIVNDFNKLTEQLDKCICDDKRRQAIADAIDKQPGAQCILRLVTKNYHLTTCAQANLRVHLNSMASLTTVSSTKTAHEDSVSSLHDMIHLEVKNKPFMQELDEKDFEQLIKCSNFKSFKRYLRSTIGTECNLKTVSSLYMCARGLLNHVGFDESADELRYKMIEFVKLYFKRYFVDKIREKGGMSALVIQDYDVD